MKTYVRVTINSSDLVRVVPEKMIGQSLIPYAKFVQQQYLKALSPIPNVTILVSARRKVPHCVLGAPATVSKVEHLLNRLKPELFPSQFADEMIAQGTELIRALEDKNPELAPLLNHEQPMRRINKLLAIHDNHRKNGLTPTEQ